MDLGLEGRVALVTGGSKGIGRAMAAGLVAEGARVAIASRSAERIEEAAAATGARGYVFDSEDLSAVDGLIDVGRGRPRARSTSYVANTGGPPAGPDPLAFTREQWEAAHRALVLSPMAFLERLLPGMRERGWGRVSPSARSRCASRSTRSSSPTPTGRAWWRPSRCSPARSPATG